MSSELAVVLIMAANFGVSLTAMLVAWLRTRRKDVDEKLGALGERVGMLERVIAGLPGRDDVSGLKLSIAELAGEIRVVGTQMSGQGEILRRLEAVVTRHEDHLLEAKR